MTFIQTLRNIIDGKQVNSAPIGDRHVSRPSEYFAVKLAQALRDAMEHQLFAPPGMDPQVPNSYVVFFSNEDNRLFPGHKRKIVQDWLFSQIAMLAAQLTKKHCTSKAFLLDMRIDATLPKGSFRIQPFWDTLEQPASEDAPAVPIKEIPRVRNLAR